MARYFDGRRFVIPTAASRLVVGAVPGVLGATGVVGVVGNSEGGKPYTEGDDAVYTFTDVAEAIEVLRSGDALEGIKHIFAPSGTEPGAQVVKFLRVDPATQASLNKSPNVYYSRDYGQWTNQIEVKVSESDGEYIVSARHQPSELSEESPKLGNVFSIQYLGAASCTMTITATALTTLVNAIEDINLDLTAPEFDTIEKVINYLQTKDEYSVTLAASYKGTYRLPSAQLDDVTDQDIKTAPYTVTSKSYSVAAWCVNESELLICDAPAAGAPVAFDWTHLSGGSNGTPSVETDWTDALDMMENQDIQLLWVSSDSAAVHTAVLAHVTAMRNENERIAFVGPASGESVSAIATRAGNLNSDYMVLCAPSPKKYNYETEEVEVVSGMMTAAAVCGLAAGKDPAIPLTRKYIGGYIIGLEDRYTKAELEELIEAGVCAIQETKNGYRVCKGVTTVQMNDRLWNTNGTTPEISLRRTVDAVLKSMRDSVDETMVGQNALYVQSYLHGLVVNVLERAKDAGWIYDDTVNGVDAYVIQSIRQVDDAWYVDFGLNLPDPVNFVFLTGRII